MVYLLCYSKTRTIWLVSSLLFELMIAVKKQWRVRSHMPAATLFSSLQQQAMLVSMKEIYSWLCILGVFVSRYFCSEKVRCVQLHCSPSSVLSDVRLNIRWRYRSSRKRSRTPVSNFKAAVRWIDTAAFVFWFCDRFVFNPFLQVKI